MSKWSLIRDICLTGTGIAVIVSQVVAALLGQPVQDALLMTALALTAPSIGAHAKELLSRPGESAHGSSGDSAPPTE